eukprot:jgi/Orpsp1_1/1183090/evm.model.c7180000083786.1
MKYKSLMMFKESKIFMKVFLKSNETEKKRKELIKVVKGIEINTTVIFDPAAASNFIHYKLANELGWSLFHEDFSIICMNKIKKSAGVSRNHYLNIQVYDIIEKLWKSLSFSTSFCISKTIPSCIILGIDIINELNISFNYDSNKILVPCINSHEDIPTRITKTSTAKAENLNLLDKNKYILDDPREDIRIRDILYNPHLCF